MKRDMLVVGFKDETKQVKEVARQLKSAVALIEVGKYRAGEKRLVGPKHPPHHVVVVANVKEDAESLFSVLLLSHELRYAGAKRVDLVAPWIAYGRQDKATRPGEEPAGLMMGRLLSAMFDSIVTLDAHSQLFIDSFQGRLTNVIPWRDMEVSGKVDLVAAPDFGAGWRASFAADALGVPFVVAEKRRVGSRVVSKLPAGISLKGARVLLIDDMADSGGTLKAAAKAIKKAGASSVTATISHAFDLCRLDRLVRPEIDVVDCYFDHFTGSISGRAVGLLVRALN